MKVLALLLVVVAAAYGQTADSGAGLTPAESDNMDPFIKLIKEIEESSFFPLLSQQNRLLTFEMLAAAETRNLELLLDRLGYVTLLEFLDALPEDYQHRFIRYSVDHLNQDDLGTKSSS